MDKHSTISPEGMDRAVLVWMQELAPHGLCITDAELRIQGWNLWMETASGVKREDAVGQLLYDVFPDIRNRKVDGYFNRALHGEISLLSAAFHQYLFPFPSPVREAEYPFMLQTARIAPLMLNGEVVGTITTVEDVTEREYQSAVLRTQTERQELFSWALAHLLQASDPEVMVKQIFPRVSAHMSVDVYFNYMLEGDGSCFCLHSASGVTRALQEKVAHRQAGEPLCEAGASASEPVVLSEVQSITDPKFTLHKQIGLQAYVCHSLEVEKKVIGTLSFGSRTRSSFDKEEIEFTRVLAQYVAIAIERSRNVVALHKAQEELSLHAESLEEKVQERTAKLQESIAELESVSYSLAHDVRAPLRHIHGYAQVLLTESGDSISPEAKGFVEAIIRSTKRLDILTKDLLEYAQVSRHRVRLMPLDIGLLVRDIAARNPGLSESGVLTIKEPLHLVLAERLLLDQCLGNLLDNALKFIPNSVRPQIEIRSEIEPGPLVKTEQGNYNSQWVKIWVEDNGIGISPEYHKKIFDLFERLSNHAEGTGIGLAIASKAITKMGGRLGVESEVGKGSRFWILLPSAGPSVL